MLKSYLNQTAVYTPCVDVDDRGQPVYEDEITVKCRLQAKTQNVYSSGGVVVQVQHVYYLDREVKEGGMLDGKIVNSVEPWTDLTSKVIGYKAVL